MWVYSPMCLQKRSEDVSGGTATGPIPTAVEELSASGLLRDDGIEDCQKMIHRKDHCEESSTAEQY